MSSTLFKLFKINIIFILFISVYSQLTILTPGQLSSKFVNNTINIEYSKIGLLTDFYIRGQIILDTISPNKDACFPLTGIDFRKINNTIYDENFKILLAYQGTCSVTEKARNAQNAGASMLILINNKKYSNIILEEEGNDINIPIGLIQFKEGKILEEYIMNNRGVKIIVEVNFKPKLKNVVELKLFFSSSEPKAYALIGNMIKYMELFGDQVLFKPYYVVHKNPYYVEENPNSNLNCVSRGVYCYYPKETTIIQDGQKILLESIRQKCMYELNIKKDINMYYKYITTFYKLCINVNKKTLDRQCSQLTLKTLGFPEDYLEQCVANSFLVSSNQLDTIYYIDKMNKILEREYAEILKYKLTSFPAVIINDKQIPGIIQEKNIVSILCNEVKEKPSFCPFFTGFSAEEREKSKSRNFIIYFLIFLLIVVNIGLFFMCRTYILEKLNDKYNFGGIDLENRIKNVINNYFVLKDNNNDYQSLDNHISSNNNTSQQFGMKEGKVNTV